MPPPHSGRSGGGFLAAASASCRRLSSAASTLRPLASLYTVAAPWPVASTCAAWLQYRDQLQPAVHKTAAPDSHTHTGIKATHVTHPHGSKASLLSSSLGVQVLPQLLGLNKACHRASCQASASQLAQMADTRSKAHTPVRWPSVIVRSWRAAGAAPAGLVLRCFRGGSRSPPSLLGAACRRGGDTSRALLLG